VRIDGGRWRGLRISLPSAQIKPNDIQLLPARRMQPLHRGLLNLRSTLFYSDELE